MLTSRISVPPIANPEIEDIFSAAHGALFTDDTVNSHGTPGSSILYRSPRFGEITLNVPAHPDVEAGRRLFAHYLWNAAVIAADAIESASTSATEPEKTDGMRLEAEVDWDGRYWDVRGKRVLELGAGTALPSLICARCGAKVVTITDHPSSPALTTGVIAQNVRDNLFGKPRPKSERLEPTTQTDVQVYGYTWGTTMLYDADKYGKPATQQPSAFDRIIIADCLWMPSQHVNLLKTILHYLDADEPGSCALVIAGFHTGRGTVRNFFELATGDVSKEGASEENEACLGDEQGDTVRGQLRAAEMFEVDVDGARRAWQPWQKNESKDQAKRWCVCAVLVRR